MNMDRQEEFFKFLSDRLLVTQQDIKNLTEAVSKLHEEIRVLTVGIIKDHSLALQKLQEDLYHPRALRISIATKVMTALLIAFFIGLLTWIGETIYKSENTSQQTTINKLIRKLKIE